MDDYTHKLWLEKLWIAYSAQSGHCYHCAKQIANPTDQNEAFGDKLTYRSKLNNWDYPQQDIVVICKACKNQGGKLKIAFDNAFRRIPPYESLKLVFLITSLTQLMGGKSLINTLCKLYEVHGGVPPEPYKTIQEAVASFIPG